MPKDYYKILGVNKDASKDEIKKAFHKLAHQHHPDKNKGNDTKFKEANEAYQVLSDDKKRANYDHYGSADMGGFNPNQGPYSGGFGGFDFNGGNGGVEFDMGDLGDIFGDFFGGSMGRNRQKVKKGRDLSTEMTLTFEESVFGIDKTITLNKQSVCTTCDGSGAKPGTKMDTCSICNGQGQVREIRRSILGNFESIKTCDNCFGTGKVPKEKCVDCHGAGIRKINEEISIKIPAGINNGETLRVRGKGEAVKGGETGDLYIKMRVKSHAIFTREGNNLMMDLKIKLTEALLGMTYRLETLDGKTVEVKIPEGINHGEMLRVRGKGVPKDHSHGDIIIRILVEMPNKLSKKNKEVIQKLKEEGL